MRTLALALALFPAMAFAQAPSVEMTMTGGSAPVHFDMTEAEQEPPQGDDYMDYATEVRLEHVVPDSVEHQFVMQAAIGEDGPWSDLDGLNKSSSWQQPMLERGSPDSVRVILEKDYLATRPDEEVALTVPAPVLAKAARKAWGDRNPNVACKSVNDAPCYTYRAADRLRFTGTDGKRYTLTLPRAGGC